MNGSPACIKLVFSHFLPKLPLLNTARTFITLFAKMSTLSFEVSMRPAKSYDNAVPILYNLPNTKIWKLEKALRQGNRSLLSYLKRISVKIRYLVEIFLDDSIFPI